MVRRGQASRLPWLRQCGTVWMDRLQTERNGVDEQWTNSQPSWQTGMCVCLIEPRLIVIDFYRSTEKTCRQSSLWTCRRHNLTTPHASLPPRHSAAMVLSVELGDGTKWHFTTRTFSFPPLSMNPTVSVDFWTYHLFFVLFLKMFSLIFSVIWTTD